MVRPDRLVQGVSRCTSLIDKGWLDFSQGAWFEVKLGCTQVCACYFLDSDFALAIKNWDIFKLFASLKDLRFLGMTSERRK